MNVYQLNKPPKTFIGDTVTRPDTVRISRKLAGININIIPIRLHETKLIANGIRFQVNSSCTPGVNLLDGTW